ncbi:MAG: 4-(cytidine 5'-diphospho)-2-C-methyl-D-erythritol kinase [Candidatus Coatesbacteria bacterium]|nr:MAG: 4-(cytidine 5'-diphospho)-2-C-methyl-D-erythritol kinase [Candidatus Coatesbacteria bacterium]
MTKLTKTTLEVEAPAKVNVCLVVTGRRPDGYHNVATVMAPLALADRLTITVDAGRGLTVRGDGPGCPPDEKNLAGQAALAFLAAAGVEACLDLHLVKNVAVGAGLGGGSSDAAATLLALNGHFGRPLGDDKLWRLARRLGSDVPFFLAGGWAFASGRGEYVTRVRGPREVQLLLASPDRGIPTARVYRALEPSDLAANADPCWEVLARLEEEAEAWWEAGVNTLEAPALRLFPVLAELKAALAELGYENARLSGSGGTFVAPRGEERTAREAQEALTARGYRVALTATR